MEYRVWSSSPVGNACWLSDIENVPQALQLTSGLAFRGRFPADARFRMSKDFKKATRLIDDVTNRDRVKVCSKRLVEFLRDQKVVHLEFLPVTILDHKGKVASREYAIVHPIGLVDALDRKASNPSYNRITPDHIDWVDSIVLDPSRLEPEARVFRMQGLTGPVLVEKTLADAIAAEGFVGPFFKLPEEVRR